MNIKPIMDSSVVSSAKGMKLCIIEIELISLKARRDFYVGWNNGYNNITNPESTALAKQIDALEKEHNRLTQY